MLLIVYFVSFFLSCHQTEAAVPEFNPTPSDTKIAIESNDLTLTWSYTLGGSVVLGRIVNITGGIEEDIAIREINGPTNVVGNYLPQGRFLANISETQAWLKILRVQSSDRGRYAFDMRITGNKRLRHEVELIIHVPPRLFSDVTVDQSVKERSDLNLYCGASGEPAPNVTWIRVFKNGSESQVLHTGVTWNIERINRTDAGKYRCTANNGVGSPVYHTITVNVSFPAKIVNFVQEYKVSVQQSVTLHCQAEGYPEPTFTWSPCNNGCNTGTVTIPEVLNDTVYTCKATNSEGSDSADASVVIAGKEINITMTIKDDKECSDAEGQYNKSSLSTELSVTMRGVFVNESNYLSTTVNNVRCGSVIVYLTLSFSAIVTEKRILNILKNAVKDGKLGNFNVDPSSIKGTRPKIPVTIRPGIGKTTPKQSDDDNVTIIIAVVVSVAVVAIIVGVAVFCVYKKKKDKKNDNKG